VEETVAALLDLSATKSDLDRISQMVEQAKKEDER
jgi:hypothetical protein